MACQLHMWSLSGLVAAFLNLAVAYLFLCVSSVAFFASKFLGFFGLDLPCPCKNIPSKEYCFDRLLVDFPAQQISNVQLSVKEKFPFNDSIWARNHNNNIGADNYANGVLELEGDASCSSVSDVRQSRNVVGREFGQRDEEHDVKGKGVISYRPRSRMHRRNRKGSISVNHGKYSAVSSYDPSLHEEMLGSIPHSHSSSNKGGDGITRGSSFHIDYGGAYNIEYKKAPSVLGRRKSNLSSVQMNNSSDDMEIKKNVPSIEDLQEAKRFCGQEGNTIQLLEQALEEARAACDTLYIELEKERNAAASAAEEAMAMILRLQEEKASIEMEARQHQRIFEEKSAYDAEEMDILKEILVRREMEKHLLEMDVEGYRQMVSPGNQQLVDDGTSGTPTKLLGLLIDPNDDPVLLLRQFSASTDEKLMIENKCSSGAVNESPIQFKNEKYISEKLENLEEQLIEMSGSPDTVNMDLQEKEIISSDGSLCLTPNCSQESNVVEKSIAIERKELEQNEEMNLVTRVDEKNPKIVNRTGTSDLHFMQSLKPKEDDVRDELNNPGDLTLEKDSHVYDVHVVGDGISICSDENINKSEKLSVGGSLKVNDKSSIPFEAPFTKCVNNMTDRPSTSGMHAEVEVKRSNSAGYHGLPPVIPKVTSKLSNLRRSSMPMVESGMLNIDNEVGHLLERLRIVKEGRDKLGFNMENRERENLHLKHLEDAPSQIQQIRRITEPGNATLSKRKRCKSVSSGLQRSS